MISKNRLNLCSTASPSSHAASSPRPLKTQDVHPGTKSMGGIEAGGGWLGEEAERIDDRPSLFSTLSMTSVGLTHASLHSPDYLRLSVSILTRRKVQKTLKHHPNNRDRHGPWLNRGAYFQFYSTDSQYLALCTASLYVLDCNQQLKSYNIVIIWKNFWIDFLFQ